jgi:CBS domain-containing protein
MSEPTNASTQRVFRRHGEESVRTSSPDIEVSADTAGVPTIADTVQLREIMTRDVVCAREDLGVDALVEIVASHRIGCVPVVDRDGAPIGMITNRDLVDDLLRTGRAPRPILEARQLMMPIVFSLDEHATVAHAAAMMAIEDVHHVAVVGETGVLVGIVSSIDIVRWLAANDGLLRT